MYILYQELAYKHKDYNRVGAINLEQLDALLDSLKTYWDYSDDMDLLVELEATNKQRPAYEL